MRISLELLSSLRYCSASHFKEIPLWEFLLFWCNAHRVVSFLSFFFSFIFLKIVFLCSNFWLGRRFLGFRPSELFLYIFILTIFLELVLFFLGLAFFDFELLHLQRSFYYQGFLLYFLLFPRCNFVGYEEIFKHKWLTNVNKCLDCWKKIILSLLFEIMIYKHVRKPPTLSIY